MPVSTLRAGPNVTMNPYCISVIKFINKFVLHPGKMPIEMIMAAFMS